MMSPLCQRWQRSSGSLPVKGAESSFSGIKFQCLWHGLELCEETIDPEAHVVIKERQQADCFLLGGLQLFHQDKGRPHSARFKAAQLVNTEFASLVCLHFRSVGF